MRMVNEIIYLFVVLGATFLYIKYSIYIISKRLVWKIVKGNKVYKFSSSDSCLFVWLIDW